MALGTAQFGLHYGIANKVGQVTRLTVSTMLQLASANGISMLDTAIAYGESETCLGEADIQDFKLVTKLPVVPDDCSDVNEWVQKQVNESLTRLGVGSVSGLLLHRSEQLLGTEGKALYQTLQNLKESGQVEKIGVSIYSPKELDVLPSCYHFDIVQAPFNLFDRQLSKSGWLHRLKDKGAEIHVRSVFLQGLLLMAKEDLPIKFAPWGGLFSKWYEWLLRNNISAVQACLAYPLSFSEIDRVIIGVDSVDQLEKIIYATQAVMPNEVFPEYCEDEKLINPSNWRSL